MMKNVLLIKGESQYDAMRTYIDEIELGFRLSGFNTIILNMVEEGVDFQIREIMIGIKIDYIFSCNGIMYNLIPVIPQAVFVTYLCDHPILHRDRLQDLREKDIVFVCDKNHCRFIEEYFPNIKNVKFVPLAGSFSQKYIPYEERKKQIVFTGTYRTPKEFYNYFEVISSKYEGAMQSCIEFIWHDIIENTEQTIDMCLKKALRMFQINNLSKECFLDLLKEILVADWYARDYYRDKVIRVLLANGLSIHVYGNGWDEFEGDYDGELIIEKGSAYVARKAVAEAKISLNLMPWFKEGFQERIATAMLSGTVAVTDESKYIIENFEDEKELVTFSLRNLEELPDKIKYLLENEEYASHIASAGKLRADQGLTWQHRTFEMIEFIRERAKDISVNNGYGKVLQIPYTRLNVREIGINAIHGIDEILGIITELRTYDVVDLSDIKYLYNKFILLFLRIKANFPNIEISEFVYKYLNQLEEKDLETGLELLMMECTNIQALYLKAEYEELSNELAKAEGKNNSDKAVPVENNSHEQEVLIKKLLQNYSDSSDLDIIEILDCIQRTKSVGPYNQEFVGKYGRITQTMVDDVRYDENAQMCYVIWNGKRMYYPKSHSKLYVASELNFVNLEQDIDSPHRYLTQDFQVKEGDIVVEAGVAEGNFALDIVEKAKKLYLVECEHEWVEALEKTFEPWKDKVVIIEKMLDEYDDETHIRIDTFVQEQQVNFIKMDVEGAETAALNGAARILTQSDDIKCAICSYHRKNAEKDIRNILKQHGFSTSTTNGYIFFREDIDSWVDGELRRGIVRGVKNVDLKMSVDFELEEGNKGEQIQALRNFVYNNFQSKYVRTGIEVGDFSYGLPSIKKEDDENAELRIGKFCSIAEGVQIWLGGNHRVDWSSTYPFNRLLKSCCYIKGHPATKGDISIGNDVWIGSDAKIMSGVTIADGCVIAANAVVVKDILEPYTVVAGVPAKVRKYRFDKDIIQKLCEMKWWDWDDFDIFDAIPLLQSNKLDELWEYYITKIKKK